MGAGEQMAKVVGSKNLGGYRSGGRSATGDHPRHESGDEMIFESLDALMAAYPTADLTWAYLDGERVQLIEAVVTVR